MELVEREEELTVLERSLEAALAGSGTTIMLEAPAGQGKTALLRTVRQRARDEGLRVLTATGATLERDFPFGVVRQLFEAELRNCDPERAERLLGGAAGLARAVFGAADASATADVSHAQLNGLFWLAVNLSEEAPLLLAVDDAHWADAPSLRFLDVLARRVEDLPIALAVAARPAEPGAEQDLLDGLALAPETRVLRPGALSHDAVAALLRESLDGELHERFAAMCVELTGGNALFVRELARTLEAQGFRGREEEVEAVRSAVPGTVTRSVVARLRRLSPAALAVARAVAVLGDRAEMRQVAELVQLEIADLAAAHADGAALGLLEPERLRFAHPLVAEAVRSEIPVLERDTLHRRAADLLSREDGDASAIAAHLMATEPGGDPQVALRLATAGRRALAGGAPAAAARLLDRAMREPPAASDRPPILLDLGIAETRLGSAEGVRHLKAAAAEGGRIIHARAVVARAGASIVRARDPEVIDELRELLEDAEGFDHHLVCRIECDLLNLLPYENALQEEYARRLEEGSRRNRPAALAHSAFLRAVQGAPRDEVRALAGRALGQGQIEHEFEHQSPAPYYAIEALHLVEASDEAAAALREARSVAQKSGSPLAMAWLAHTETGWQRLFGNLADAVAELQPAVELLRTTDARRGAAGVIAMLAATLADQRRFEEARERLAEIPDRDDPMTGLISLPVLAARVHLALGRPTDALEEIDRQLEFEAARGWRVSPLQVTRCLRASALAATGRRDEAVALARDEVALARRRDVAGHEARARMALAELLEREEARAELERAVQSARRSPSLLVQAEALGALGAAQRRGNERAEARETLREARELAHRCGATGLETSIHEELVVAGARPQRIALAGVESLTASERRVAELAADGLRNREIAEALFVTLKTVEVHLGRAYGKLDIKGRSQLAGALGRG